MNREFFGGNCTMKLKHPKRPHHMFLYDPEFRHRYVDANQVAEGLTSDKGSEFIGEKISK